jgi:cytochrome c oxidase subunit 2
MPMPLNLNKIFGPKIGGYNFQESGNFFMDNIIYFHDLVLCILFFISMLVSWFLFTTLLYFGNAKLYYKLSNQLYYLKNYYNNLLQLYLFSFNIYKKEISRCLKLIGFFKDDFFEKEFKSGKFFTKRSSLIIFFNNINLKNINIKFKPLFVKLPNIVFNEFLYSKNIEYRYYFYSDVKLEFVWTLFPSLVLLLLAIPSFGLLFSVEKVSAPELTVKVIGHQWYWEYQYMDYIDFKQIVPTDLYTFIYKNKNDDNYIIESYMINDEDLEKGQYRLLEVDKKLILPINTSIRMLITSDDVLHSWAVPSLGIKVDACPGRINELLMKIREVGLYYGQCSELCGWYHGFMPIVIQSLNIEDFKIWTLSTFIDVKYISNSNLNDEIK